MLCKIYKSDHRDEMYLYLPQDQTIDQLPDQLAVEFASEQHIMSLEITPQRQLARTDATRVIEAIEQHGYYLQMPPPKEGAMAEVGSKNQLLPRG